MSPITKHRLIQDIFFSLQTRHSIREMVSIINGYGITNDFVNVYKQEEVKKLLSKSTDKTLFLIASDLQMDTANYITKKEINADEDQEKVNEKEVQKQTNRRKKTTKYPRQRIGVTGYSFVVNLDKVLSYVVALGLPKLLFTIAIATSEFGGAAAITSRLKQISLNMGMNEGIGVFVLMGLASYKLSEYCLEKYFEDKIEKEILKKKFKNITEILNQIDTYWVSESLRLRLKTIYVLKNY